MKECNYSKDKYWLCEDSLAKTDDSWLNTGHPCKYSSHNLLDGSIECTKTGQELSFKERDRLSYTLMNNLF